MVKLAGPFEILELADGQVIAFSVVRWELGEMTIVPRWPGAAAKEIRVLRLWVSPGDKPIGLSYWDITSQTAIAQIVPLLQAPPGPPWKVQLRAYGVAPRKRFTVTVQAG